MPVNKVYKSGKLYGYRWGQSGKVYSVKKYGQEGAYNRSEKQARAIFASGWKSVARSKYALPRPKARRRSKY